jgi:hypothetical protein
MNRLSLVGFSTILTCLAQGCITYAAPHCQGGFCDVTYTPIEKHDPKKVVIHPMDEPLPPNAIKMGTFLFPGSIYDRCSDEILDFFRQKAAKLGFDGVAEIRVYWGGTPQFIIMDQQGGVYNSQQSNQVGSLKSGPPAVVAGQKIDAFCGGIAYILRKEGEQQKKQ